MITRVTHPLDLDDLQSKYDCEVSVDGGEWQSHNDERRILQQMLDDVLSHIHRKGYSVETCGCEEISDLVVVDHASDDEDYEDDLCLCCEPDCEQCAHRAEHA